MPDSKLRTDHMPTKPQPGSPSNGNWVLAATILGSSLAFIDGTVVNVALPVLQTSLNATASQLQWIVEAYALFLAALLLVGGSLGDLYGRRKIFLAGTVLFALASAWCGLAPDIHHLIAARAVQGIGAALLVPGSLSLISSSFPEETRGRAIGTWSGFTAITAAAGPLLGGWLVQHASWRWVFFINLPLALAVVLIATLRVSETAKDTSRKSLDWIGALLATAGLGSLTFALLEWQSGGTALHLIALFGAALLALFLFIERRAPAPMLPLELFRSRNFVGANLLTLFLYGALSGVLYYLPLDLIQVQRYTPTEAGASLLPFILLISLLSRWSGGLIQSYGPRLPLIVGPAISAAGFALLLRPALGHSYWTTFFPAMIVLGLGMAISVAPLTTVVMGSVAQDHAGAASGINNAVSRVAGLLALAAFGIVVFSAFTRSLDQRLDRLPLAPAVRQAIAAQKPRLAAIATDNPAIREAVGAAFLTGYHRVILTGVVLCLAASLSAATILSTSEEPQLPT